MIKFSNPSQDTPYLVLRRKYDEALNANQEGIDAISISSYSNVFNEVNSRFVNLKIVNNNEFIFFSNYNSPKSLEFRDHNQITALIYWNSIKIQIRIKAVIKKTSRDFNKEYFFNRSKKKNALAISSNQSKPISSFQEVIENHKKSLLQDNLKECPKYWGGYSFTPYYFEFWEGHESRINKREVYVMEDGDWSSFILQP